MSQPSAKEIRARLLDLADPTIAAHSRRFFKTGPGQYGEGDTFLGIRVPVLRRLAAEFRAAPERAIWTLLRSAEHEARLLALLMLVARFERSADETRERIYRRYVDEIHEHVNNWDLVDSSAPGIVGAYLERRSRRPLHALARSRSLWERRVAIIATHRLIRRGSFADTFAITELLLGDTEDLIHKAAGWMLREVANRSRPEAEAFLRRHYRQMPRTMLRYAIEKFPEAKRRAYLEGRVR
jgi:3-methyladenine DNA glycosylase AlkD